MYGDLGNKLVQHAKRAQSLNYLPVYQVDLVKSVTREVRDLDRDVARILEEIERNRQQAEDGDGSAGPLSSFNPADDPAMACILLVDHLSMRRNKRCLIAYHRIRTEKIEDMCWNGIDPLDEQRRNQNNANAEGSTPRPSQPTSSLMSNEEEYFRQYNEMLMAYKGQWTDVDLTGSLTPPQELYIDVRVLKDAGEIQTEYG
ncbi:DNA replication protein psf1 [Myotisia sp. PD_48]|nr:DNA replication protein psf1 [Myotisia sp. PD_48]